MHSPVITLYYGMWMISLPQPPGAKIYAETKKDFEFFGRTPKSRFFFTLFCLIRRDF